MLSVLDALTRILSHFQALDSEAIPSESAVGRVLAESICATLDLPPFPNSSMDGYAVRAADVRAATSQSPAKLTVIGDVPAGVLPTLEVSPGAAARIMTGAHLPTGADAVIPIEATDDQHSSLGGPLPASVQIMKAVEAGAFVRQTGEDVRTGDEVLSSGTLLRPYDLGVLAALGLTRIRVIRRPRVAILSTGDELVNITETPGPGQIRNVNSLTLAALVKKYGGEPTLLGVAPDNLEAVLGKLHLALEQKADVIISSAGVSVGAYDVVKTAVEREGALEFWKVNMRPGKPLAFGRVRNVPFFGLPGNPVSAIVGFELFVRPAILKLGGHSRLEKPTVKARLAEPFYSDGRESYLRATVTREDGVYVARSAGRQGSNIISALTRANALLVMAEGLTEALVGDTLPTLMLDWPEEVL
ncbi:MAG: molybdopterin molybdotransferase MoeA [Chloroflexi bacterium]|nr:molybdopterin molybdotransferase MoeA [Chloroflexota bacterium]